MKPRWGRDLFGAALPGYAKREPRALVWIPFGEKSRDRGFLVVGSRPVVVKMDTRRNQHTDDPLPRFSSRSGGGTENANHRVESVSSEGSVLVFGGESHGMYLEAFDEKTGKCLYRFCTCYRFNFSESWNVG